MKCASFICSRSFLDVDARAVVRFGKFSLLLKLTHVRFIKILTWLPRLSHLAHFSIFVLFFFVLNCKSLLGVKSQWSLNKTAFLSQKPLSHRTWAIKTAWIIYSVDLRSFKLFEQRKTLVSINWLFPDQFELSGTLILPWKYCFYNSIRPLGRLLNWPLFGG